MRRERKQEVARSMALLGKALGQPARQVAVSVIKEVPEEWATEFRAKGYVPVRKPWGTEWYVRT